MWPVFVGLWNRKESVGMRNDHDTRNLYKINEVFLESKLFIRKMYTALEFISVVENRPGRYDFYIAWVGKSRFLICTMCLVAVVTKITQQEQLGGSKAYGAHGFRDSWSANFIALGWGEAKNHGRRAWRRKESQFMAKRKQRWEKEMSWGQIQSKSMPSDTCFLQPCTACH